MKERSWGIGTRAGLATNPEDNVAVALLDLPVGAAVACQGRTLVLTDGCSGKAEIRAA